MAKPAPLYQLPGRASEVDRTPRTYTTTQTGRDSYLTRPPAVRDASSDAKSWSRQTEDALDAYKQGNEKYRTDIDNSHAGQQDSYEKSHGVGEKVEVKVSEYRLDSGKSTVLASSRIVELDQPSEKSAASYYATYIEAAELELDEEQEPKVSQSPPKNHRMTRMVVKEDIDFLTALLEGHDPPTTTTETRTFVRDETETIRHSQEARAREDELRRREEAEVAKGDTDFFMMLMQKE